MLQLWCQTKHLHNHNNVVHVVHVVYVMNVCMLKCKEKVNVWSGLIPKKVYSRHLQHPDTLVIKVEIVYCTV